jgi:hypothetical protein
VVPTIAPHGPRKAEAQREGRHEARDH